MFSTSLLDTDKIGLLTCWVQVTQCKPMDFIYTYLAGVMDRLVWERQFVTSTQHGRNLIIVWVYWLPVGASVSSVWKLVSPPLTLLSTPSYTLISGGGDEEFRFFLSNSLEYFLLLLFLVSVLISLIFIWGLKDLFCNIIFFFRLDKLTHDPVDEQTVFEVRLFTVIIAARRLK